MKADALLPEKYGTGRIKLYDHGENHHGNRQYNQSYQGKQNIQQTFDSQSIHMELPHNDHSGGRLLSQSPFPGKMILPANLAGQPGGRLFAIGPGLRLQSFRVRAICMTVFADNGF